MRGDGQATTCTRRQVLASLGLAGASSLAGCGETPVTFNHPAEVRTDERFSMTVEGLPEDTTVTVTVEGAETNSRSFTAAVTVKTGQGRIDLSEATVVDGDVPTDLGVPASVAMLQFVDVSRWTYEPLTEETLTYTIGTDGEQLGSTSLTRTHPDLEASEEPDLEQLVGELFTAPGDDAAPGVLVLHGSGGEPATDAAAILARNGFTAFALQYFAAPGLPDELVEVPLEYVRTAAEWLHDHDRVSGDLVGALGYSKGGELALLAGSEFDEIGPVVSVAGSGVVWEGYAAGSFPRTSSWTLDGEPVPYVPYAEDGWRESLRTGYENSLREASRGRTEAATIPVENIRGPVLLVSGGNDRLWDAVGTHDIAADRLETHGHEQFDHLVYDEAGHAIVPRYLPVSGTVSSARIEYGGTRPANAEASHDHWPRLVETLSAGT